jgi:hypothetical protein
VIVQLTRQPQHEVHTHPVTPCLTRDGLVGVAQEKPSPASSAGRRDVEGVRWDMVICGVMTTNQDAGLPNTTDHRRIPNPPHPKPLCRPLNQRLLQRSPFVVDFARRAAVAIDEVHAGQAGWRHILIVEQENFGDTRKISGRKISGTLENFGDTILKFRGHYT